MQIERKKLTGDDIGRAVIYIPNHANGDMSHSDVETGFIKSWNENWVFVRYHLGDTAAATNPENLRWN